MEKIKSYEVIIIGGSYAGLSAALSLGRAFRKVLIIDSGKPCNRYTPFSHNFLTGDGETPAGLFAKAKKDVLDYPSIEFLEAEAVGVTKSEEIFTVETNKKKSFTAKKLIFATGIKDIFPDMEGFANCWGVSILHCPYCHGYEFKDAKTGVLGNGEEGYEQVKLISHWAQEIILFTNGKSTLTYDHTKLLENNNICIEEKEIAWFEHVDGYIQNIVFKDNSKQSLKALYAKPEIKQQTDLPKSLGCNYTDHGRIDVDLFQKTNVPGVYAVGDNSSMGRSVSVAVAAGSIAGTILNKELISEELIH